MPKPYPREFHEDVVRVARNLGPGVTLTRIAQDFGIHEMTISMWLDEVELHDDGASEPEITRALTEIRDLHLAVLRTELGRFPSKCPATGYTTCCRSQVLDAAKAFARSEGTCGLSRGPRCAW